MPHMWKTATLCMLALTLSSCGGSTTSTSPTTAPPQGWKTYTYGQAAISVPPKWVVHRMQRLRCICTGNSEPRRFGSARWLPASLRDHLRDPPLALSGKVLRLFFRHSRETGCLSMRDHGPAGSPMKVLPVIGRCHLSESKCTDGDYPVQVAWQS